jgi:type IV pilus assembly protein PilO
MNASKRQISIAVALLLLSGLVCLYIYFAVVKELQLEIEQAKQEIKVENTLQAKRKQKSKTVAANEGNTQFMLQKLPTRPLLDQYILDLTNAESISGVVIQSTVIQEGVGASVSAKGTKEGKITEAQLKPIPVVLNVEVKYTAYEQLQSFIDTVENMARITHIQGIDFKGREEIVSADMMQEPYKCTVTLATYYVPAKELDQDVSQFELPALCKDRNNPLEPQVCK